MAETVEVRAPEELAGVDETAGLDDRGGGVGCRWGLAGPVAAVPVGIRACVGDLILWHTRDLDIRRSDA